MPIPEPVERIIVKVGQAGCRAVQQAFSLAVEQHDAAQHIRPLLLHTAHDGTQYRRERCAMSQQFQHMVAGLFALLRPLSVSEISGEPALDEYDVEDCGSDTANQQQEEY